MEKEKLIKLAEDLYQSAFDANAYYGIMMQYREMSKKYNNENESFAGFLSSSVWGVAKGLFYGNCKIV